MLHKEYIGVSYVFLMYVDFYLPTCLPTEDKLKGRPISAIAEIGRPFKVFRGLSPTNAKVVF